MSILAQPNVVILNEGVIKNSCKVLASADSYIQNLMRNLKRIFPLWASGGHLSQRMDFIFNKDPYPVPLLGLLSKTQFPAASLKAQPYLGTKRTKLLKFTLDVATSPSCSISTPINHQP